MRLPLRRPPSFLLCLTAVLALQTVAADEDVVVNLQLSPTPDMIDASWELENSTGDVSQYTVTYVSDEGNPLTWYLYSSTTNTSASNSHPILDSCTHYNVTVQPRKEQLSAPVDTGTPASDEAFTLAEEPPAVTSLQVTEVGSRNLTLQWVRPKTLCTITEYIITYGGTTLWSQENIDEDQVSVTEFNDDEEIVQTELQDLTPYSTYTITVVAVTEAGEGEDSLPLYAQTDEDVPGAPSSFEAESVNATTVYLHWYSPKEENGILTQYTVRWRLANDTTEVNTMSVPIDQNVCYVSGLQECVLYFFSITASTSAGEGPGALTNGSAMVAEPKAPEVVCYEVGWTNYVVWSAPTSSCPIEGYDIHYTMDVHWSDDEDSEWLTVPASETTFQVNNTTPYSDYTYEIRAIVAGGVRGSDGHCSITTPEAAPSAPQNLRLVDRTDNSLTIRWEEPAELNGDVERYTVEYTNENSNIHHSDAVSAYSGDTLFVHTISYLASGTGYIVEVRAYTVEDGPPTVDEFFTSGSPAPTAAPGTASSASSPSSILIAVLSLLAIVVFVVLILVFYQKEKNRRRLRSSPGQLNLQRTTRGSGPAQNGSQSQILNTIRRFESEPESLTQAFADLKARSRDGPTNVAQVPQNIPKNRDRNVLPFDDTRVKLSSEAKISSDYINASHVKDGAGRQKIIASQGPTDVTLADFWQMVWQENVNLIIMLTKCEENGEAKCCQYWPDSTDDSVSVDTFSVCLRSAAVEPGLCRRELGLQNGEYPPRVIRQFHFTRWPERGVPASETAMLQLLDRVRAEDFGDNKILVHCSAGDGRTGTFIALWNLQQKALSGEILDVDRTILEMREARQGLIQTESQYLFVHKCIAMFLTAIQNRTAAGNLSQPSPASGHQMPVLSPLPVPPPPTAQMDAPPPYSSLHTNPAFHPSKGQP